MKLIVWGLILFAGYSAWAFSSVLTTKGAISHAVSAEASGITDEEGFPIEKLPRALAYWPWLGWQIVLSALNVTRLILHPRLPISPTMVKVDAQQDSAVGLTTYANSITLTPGTISVEISEQGKSIWVHAITRENADGFADDEMNRWVAWMNGVAESGGKP